MSAPVVVLDGGQSSSGQNRDLLEDRLRKLLPPLITSEDERWIEKIASGVSGKIKAASDSESADSSIGEGLRAIEPSLKCTHNWCTAQRVIGEELGKAYDQPVRRIVSPPQKKVAKVPKAPEEDPASSEEFANSATDQPVQPAAVVNPVHLGRKMKWDRLDEDSYIKEAVDEAGEYLPVRSGEAHPKAVILLSRLMNRLGVPVAALAEALSSDPTVLSPDGEPGSLAD